MIRTVPACILGCLGTIEKQTIERNIVKIMLRVFIHRRTRTRTRTHLVDNHEHDLEQDAAMEFQDMCCTVPLEMLTPCLHNILSMFYVIGLGDKVLVLVCTV